MKDYKFKIRGNDYSVKISSHEDNVISLEVNGTPYDVELDQEVKTTKTPKLVRTTAVPKQDAQPLKVSSGLKKIEAPLPGNIFKVNVNEGDAVKKGQTMMILEAMKMENNILAEKDGVVKSIKVTEGQAVLQGDILAEIE